MLNLICSLIAKIVFTSINGVVLILLLGFIFYIYLGQAEDFRKIAKQIIREGR
ncbi:hypothetical protein [Tissierella sp.]|uniref:hypothetical protein n=1 Tax=Tissierella sp. TaxID=41274 RepID=UPI00285EB409|nr:hypothetical protein [Tissierella sp.]MDR7856018.1 hypothetical protein [Tissierella sp.]